MATKNSENRKQLVEGCGTILKKSRLKGGYRLVKRKKAIGESTESAPAKKRGRKKGSVVAKAVASVSAPAKRRGRPAKAKVVASAPVSAPAKRRGRPAKAKAVASVSAPAKRGRKKGSVVAKAMKPSVKRVASAPAKRRGRRKSVKA
jgi:hypothetical protein